MSDREKFLRATRILVDADLKRGIKNEKSIKDFLEKEDYETLAVIKDVYESNNLEMEL